ncbi:protein-disulfide reductase DsbD [Iodobacter fluviatilis]|uniref:Thiol:disulfide interchange protein DsbD n=1 Tax=Iodobacter fluviatilis TaxID=537 RepID=A0A377Q3T6_9NEIS|nr:protein-disulfide reductase DsbD [Iodobacter fluviatilis]TCU90401.1 thiol:disulfide interchange protein DsbD [Iodobacter fluviatilis]STQ89428.1 Thiol:disulfide interchange protein DsbD precursor [Iodobacter fluviatilis]
MLKILSALLCVISMMAWAEPDTEFLEPEQALKMSASARDHQTVEVRFAIAQGYYLYKNKLKISADQGVQLGEIDFPASLPHDDPNFGKVETYRGQLVLPVQIKNPAAQQFKLTVIAQGCADAGLCYPPITQIADIKLAALARSKASAVAVLASAIKPAVNTETPVIKELAKETLASASVASAVLITAVAPAVAAPLAQASDTGQINSLLGSGNLTLILFSFFGFGLLLALTPCVFPMMPILSGIIIGHGDQISKKRAFVLSLFYVLGMAVSYAAAGVAAGLSGSMLSAALQNIWVLGAFALVFVLLSLSMFGFYELQLPASLQSKISGSANRQQGGSMLGVLIMGALSALIVGPCVAAPLAGALLYIAQTHNAVLGGAALFVMALGMGVPLIMVACAASALPRAGAWMENIKKVFGVLLLAVAIWLVSPVLPAVFAMLAWAALLIISAIFLRAIDPLPADSKGWPRFCKGLGVIALLAGSALLIGALSGGRDPLQPLQGLQAQAKAESYPAFSKVSSLAQLGRELAQTNQPVMLDFYADWCVSCKEMEKLTFSNPEVAARMGQMKRLQVDVTANTDNDKALLKRFKLFGPPGIIFFNKEGKELQSSIGFKSAEPFKQLLDQVLAK